MYSSPGSAWRPHRSRTLALSISILPLHASSLVSSRVLLTLSTDHRSSVSLAARCAPAIGSTFSRSFSLRSASVKGFLWCPGNGRDVVGQRMLGGLARDGIPRVLAYLDQVIVGALLGEHAYLFDPGKILDPGPSVNGGLYGALRHGADRPALHEGLAHPSERD